MRVGGDSPGRCSGGSAGDRDEPRAIAGPIYSAGEAGAAAASMPKSGFGGSLLTNMAICPQMRAVCLMVTPSSPTKYISKDIVAKVGRVLFCNYYRKNVAFLLLSCCSSLVSDDFLSHSRFLAIDLNKSKLFCTIKM